MGEASTSVGPGSPVLTPTGGTAAGGTARPVLIGIAIVAVVVIVGVIVALVRPSTPATYPAGSPEAAFQGQYSAWQANDLETAYGFFSSDVQASLTLAGYRQAVLDYSWQQQEDRRVVLEAASVTGDRAVLSLRIETFDPGGLGGNRYSWERDVHLVNESGAWRVDEALVGVESAPYYGK